MSPHLQRKARNACNLFENVYNFFQYCKEVEKSVKKARSFGWTDENIYLLEKFDFTYLIKNVLPQTQDKCYLYLFTLCFSGKSSHWKYFWYQYLPSLIAEMENGQVTFILTRWTTKPGTIRSIKKQMAFRSVSTTHLFGIWSNKTDSNLEDSDCTVQMLLFISIGKKDSRLELYNELKIS